MKQINWKINRDSYYKDLFEKYSFQYIIGAGFFNDTTKRNVDVLDSLNTLCTPINGFNLGRKKKCVLLSTGAFTPIHNGHINMMKVAKLRVEADGWNCVAGYLSPGHDEYISEKNGNEAIPIHYRIQLINDAIKDISWLKVDPWEGIFNNVAINFTDVIVRLEAYLKYHLNSDITVFYVCGSDNARFAKTFENKGHCIIVDRPNYNATYSQKTHDLCIEYPKRILSCDGNVDLSSTQIRRELKWKLPQQKKLQLRINNDKNENELTTILSKYYSSIIKHKITEQKLQFLKIQNKTISMDAVISGTYDLKISRAYDLFGINNLGFINRPGSKSINEQIRKINKSFSYTLFDDDIHTGNTMRYVKSSLENKNIIVAQISSLNMSTPENSEILDARDFFLGNEDNGLVIKLPNNKYSRAPYIYPFVDPLTRCTISDPLQFSIDIWEMNYKYFAKRVSLKLNSFPNHLELFKCAGFTENDTILKVCKYYLNMLQKLKKK